MKKVLELLGEVRRKGVHLAVDPSGAHLKIKGNIARLSDQDKQALAFHKADILALLQDSSGAAFAAIAPVAAQPRYALSSSQTQLWLLSRVEASSIAYNVPVTYQFEGELDVPLLRSTLDDLVARHEILRTVFREDEQGEVWQHVLTPTASHFQLECTDFQHHADPEQTARAFANRAVAAPFDLHKGPLLRAHLLQLAPARWVFTCVLHHIVSDAWSMQVLIRELFLLYNAKVRAEPSPLAPLRIHYKDYAAWQAQHLSGEALRRARAYWLEQLAGELPVLALTPDKSRPAVKTYNGGVVHSTLDAALCDNLGSLVQQQGATLFMGLLAAVNALLYRYTQQQDLLVGSPTAGREHADLANQIGFYVNTLALRTRLDEADSFTQLLLKTKKTVLDAHRHQHYPFERLVEELHLTRDVSRNALFDVMVVLQNAEEASLATAQLGKVAISAFEADGQTGSKLDLTFHFYEADSHLQVRVEYNSDLYTHPTIERLSRHLNQLLAAALASPATPLAKLAYLSPAEQQQLAAFAAPITQAFPQGQTLVSLVEEQASRQPHAIALHYKGKEVTYAELQRRANQFAAYLCHRYAIGSNDLVALRLDRTERAIIALLGILKAGGAYVPVDPAYPQERIDFVLADSACKVLVDEAELDRFEAEASQYSPQHQTHLPQPTDLAYVIYTSGSTGTPKGVMLEHGSVVNTIYAQQLAFAVQDGEKALQFASLAFDASVSEIFVALASGGTLHLIAEDEKKNPLLLQRYIAEHGIDLATIPPVYLKTVDVAQIKSLKKLVTAGEAAVVGKAAEYSKYGTYFNAYGPTESSICASVLRINQAEWVNTVSVSIGSPIANTQVYILNEAEGLQPVGAVGEICIAGAGLARGYLNAPELTAQKFVANPFKAGERMYKTGDLGRWLPDGNIDFIGRKDNQVKIRGYRVELEEIESVLQRHPEVEAAVVVAQPNASGEKELVAYLTGASAPALADIRALLKQQLPAYMMPSHFIHLEKMPVNASGKVDKTKLLALEGTEVATGTYVAPRTPTEEKLVRIWQDILQRQQIGATDDFFELGGHSLKTNRLVSRLNKEFNVRVAFGDLFTCSVLEQQAQLVERSQKAAFAGIPRVMARAGYPLSSAQQRLWLLSQLEGSGAAYNIPGTYLFEGVLNVPALALALRSLVARHESLRTVFRPDATGEVIQQVLPVEEAGFELVEADWQALPQAEEKIRQRAHALATTAFDLAAGPLLRAELYRASATTWVFTCVMHHIISDGWSMLLLVRELLQAYEAFCQGEAPKLPSLRIQYKDYAVWQQIQSAGEAAEAHRAFWQQQLAGDLPTLALPGDKVRPALKTYHGAAVTLRFDAALTDGLKTLLQAQEATLFMGLFALVNTLLYRYSGQEDIVLGTIVAGREHTELEDQIGLYINTLPLRTRFSGATGFDALLRTVKDHTLAAYQHQAYPFDELVNALHLPYDKSRNPLFDVSVVLQIADMPEAEGLAQGALNLKSYPTTAGYISKFDISFDFIEVGDELHASLVFNTDIYLQASIEQMGRHLTQLLEAVVAHPTQALEELDYLRPAEKYLLTETFNDTAVAYPRDKSIAALFAEQVSQTPDKVAVVCENTALTYRALDEQSSKLAGYLRTEAQVQPGDRVALLLDRSEKVLVAILGVLKAGAAYVPIEPEHPRARQEFVLADTGAKVLITQMDYLFDLDFYTGSIFAIDVQLDDLELPAAPASLSTGPEDLAYVMYTSGSTGQPKGVLVSQRSVVRLVKANGYVPFTGAEVLLATGALSFDATTFEYWGMLLNGGQLVMTSRNVLLDTKALAAEISRHRVTLMWFTAGWLNQLVDLDLPLFAGLATIVAGGDKLSPRHIQRLLLAYPALRVVNGYGPTENTTFSLTYPVVEAVAPIPVGKPISNSQVYILDHRAGLLPIGAVGEVCVSGDGLAQGYLNQPALTAEKFVANPFRGGERMYKTGDLGRWLPDGNIAFIGRTDNQIKIRGFRVELTEIEHALQQLGGIAAAVVVARANDQADKVLVAYLAGPEVPAQKELKAYLDARLPAYMVPTHFVPLEAFPLTTNGKINRDALPDPTGAAEPAEQVAPRTEQEAQLAAIWQALLGRESVGVTDNFFEIGGDSIKILRMVSEMRQKMRLEVAVADIYKHGSIADILVHTLQNQGRAHHRAAAEAAVLANIGELKERILVSLPPAEQPNVEDIFPMSDIEKGMVYESLVQHGRGIYHDQLVHQRAYPAFDSRRLQRALALLVEKHAILRTSFHLGTLEADVQIVHRSVPVALPFEDLAHLASNAQEAAVQAYIAAEHERPFEVASAPLWRMQAFALGADEVVVVFQFHHAILDGWSHASFVTELNNLYLQLGQDPTYQPAPLKSSYKDFIIQHEADKQDEAVRAYWEGELAGYKRLDLFTQEQQAFTSYTHIAEPTYERQLEKLATELHTSVKAISLTAYLYLLRLLNYEADVVAGLVTNTRPGCEDGDKVLGCFLNTIPLRMGMEDELSAAQLIGQVQRKLVALKENERLSLLEIAGLHNVQLRAGNPFFDTFFNYIDFHTYADLQDAGTVAQEAAIQGHTHTNILLDVSVNRTGGMYAVSFTLSRTLRSGHSVADLSQLYFRVLDSFVRHPHRGLRQAEYLGAEEEQLLLHAYNETAAPCPTAGTVVELFEAQAHHHPHRTALVFGGRTASYQALHAASNQLARFLQARYAIQPDDLIGLKLERSDELLVALLGVLKAGAAYVPIDPGYPQERIAYIVEDSQCKGLIDAALLRTFGLEMARWNAEDLAPVSTPQNLAYVIYTSGSTGQPKGCGITHHNLFNYISWANQHYFGPAGPANLGLFTSLSFDLTVTSIFCPLTQGGELYIYPQQDDIHDILAHSFGGTSAINAIKLTPSHIQVLAGLGVSSAAVGCAIVGGEQLTTAQVQALHRINPALRVYNEYGPTEATVGCVVALVPASAAVPIGKPIANTQVYVLNSGGMPAPRGVVGELFVGGDGVARGYLNMPALTAERFTPNPFREGTRLYSTGDLVRWNQRGDLEYLGRKDNQLKIRGYRVEPGEVESALARHPDVGTAAVVAVEVRGEPELAAYFVANRPLATPDLRRFLGQHLPAHMVPGQFIQLEAFPLSPNGKLDKSQLPTPAAAGAEATRAYVAPRTEAERRLQAIWQEVLGREPISVTENFFDAGGHSIKATRLASHIYKQFEVKLPLATLFSVPVLQEQALLLEQAPKTGFAAIPALPAQAHYPLSSAQRRLWILSQFAGESEAYNIPAFYLLQGAVDVAAIRHAFDHLISRHEILRTVFQEDSQGEVGQIVKAPSELAFALAVERVSTREALEEILTTARITPFDLAAGPLLRATLIETGPGQWVLAYVLHHLISDGWSANIMMHELLSLYRAHQQGLAASLPPLRIQYKDYAAWQQAQLLHPAFEGHKTYWRHELAGNLPVLALPKHQARPAVKTHNGASIQLEVPAELVQGLREQVRHQQGTLFMGLLAAVNSLLYSQTGQQDIIVGSPVAGREHPDLENQLGFYLNTLALRTRFSEAAGFRDLLAAAQRVLLGAYEHQALPFDELVQALQLPRDASRNFLFDVWLVLHNTDVNSLSEGAVPAGLRVSGVEPTGPGLSKFDLLFSFVEVADRLHLALEYNTDLFTAGEAQALTDQFTALLRLVTAQPDVPLRTIREGFAQAEAASQQEHQRNVRTKNIGKLTKKSL